VFYLANYVLFWLSKIRGFNWVFFGVGVACFFEEGMEFGCRSYLLEGL
jgi:hypothetical protein